MPNRSAPRRLFTITARESKKNETEIATLGLRKRIHVGMPTKMRSKKKRPDQNPSKLSPDPLTKIRVPITTTMVKAANHKLPRAAAFENVFLRFLLSIVCPA